MSVASPFPVVICPISLTGHSQQFVLPSRLHTLNNSRSPFTPFNPIVWSLCWLWGTGTKKRSAGPVFFSVFIIFIIVCRNRLGDRRKVQTRVVPETRLSAFPHSQFGISSKRRKSRTVSILQNCNTVLIEHSKCVEEYIHSRQLKCYSAAITNFFTILDSVHQARRKSNTTWVSLLLRQRNHQSSQIKRIQMQWFKIVSRNLIFSDFLLII